MSPTSGAVPIDKALPGAIIGVAVQSRQLVLQCLLCGSCSRKDSEPT